MKTKTYTICGGKSAPVTAFDSQCKDIYNKKRKSCGFAVDDTDNGTRIKPCTTKYASEKKLAIVGFETSYDYCICGDSADKVIPITD